ncbi:hypothetical protein CC85DRAFT_75582 [Cutaneotrichosporon oleaginosum]|uniref:Uncharacterized protein n=1 Tax=Cutaneotrichosporon oleaginosum TaxID=879819 RepID=A0A0J0XP41_9TREE|nr:uncharacterized protein CC85DRAFT_75582 [Cutaneotrichosporon oleaginosum]KLT42832.1 hypothetical protein CC85DRAFT_75582 [Cutaneotrichosporon oleaginosum]TXT08202.1 hypothetical protein COLE_05126 [Cutaneotrichosporon oleaginosum]
MQTEYAMLAGMKHPARRRPEGKRAMDQSCPVSLPCLYNVLPDRTAKHQPRRARARVSIKAPSFDVARPQTGADVVWVPDMLAKSGQAMRACFDTATRQADTNPDSLGSPLRILTRLPQRPTTLSFFCSSLTALPSQLITPTRSKDETRDAGRRAKDDHFIDWTPGFLTPSLVQTRVKLQCLLLQLLKAMRSRLNHIAPPAPPNARETRP